MKILILSTAEQGGGAAIAAKRLMIALNKTQSCEVKMLVRDKVTDDPNVLSINTNQWKKYVNFLRFAYERWVIFRCLGFKKKNLFAVSIANTGTNISTHPLVQNADILHLNWINQGFLSLKNIQQLIKLGKPIVWSMHDMWTSTGIFHLVAKAGNCNKPHSIHDYSVGCGFCPFLNARKKNDLSFRIVKIKQFLAKSNVHIVTVSSWLQHVAHNSIVTKQLDSTVIPNVIDTNTFSPADKDSMREKYSLPINKKIIALGAAKLNDPIKGVNYLKQALDLLKKQRNDLLLILFGGVKNDPTFLEDIPVECIYMGHLTSSSTIAEIYAAADVTVSTSYYETFGQTLIEAMACGCPVVSFNNSGQTDIIDHKRNGYLADYQNVDDLANGIAWVLDYTDQIKLSMACVEKVRNNFNEQVVAQKYVALYEKLIDEQLTKNETFNR
jgi:glycosyltransferase involved in cell wall biosynthesis